MEKNNVISTNLYRLRNGAGYTQKRLSEISKISVPCIKKIENGESTPEIKTLRALAKAFDVSVFSFVEEEPVIEQVRFRARSSKLKPKERQLIIHNITKWIRNYSYVEEITGSRSHFEQMPLSSKIEPEKIASEFRKRYEIDENSPICSPYTLIEKMGIKILFYDTNEDFSGLSVSDNECGQAIVINNCEKISTEHKIFTTFHEIGHLIMHLSGYSISKEDESEDEEREADEFASYLLMPRLLFRKVLLSTRGLPLVDRVFKTKQYFKVSYKTVLKRLIDEKMCDQSIWKNFAIQYKKKTQKDLKSHKEPYSIEPEMLSKYDFWGDRLARLTIDAFSQEKISASRGAEILNIPVSEFCDRVQNNEVALYE